MNGILKNAREVYKNHETEYYRETIRKTADELERLQSEHEALKKDVARYNDKVQIHKEFQTKIKSFRIKLNCECGGEMSYTTLSMFDDYTSMIVKCDKCKKSSSLTIHFNDYKKVGKKE